VVVSDHFGTVFDPFVEIYNRFVVVRFTAVYNRFMVAEFLVVADKKRWPLPVLWPFPTVLWRRRRQNTSAVVADEPKKIGSIQ